MKKLCNILMLIGVLSVWSCDHQDLCYDHPPHSHRHHINILADYRCEWEEHLGGPDWKNNWPADYPPYESYKPSAPMGLRVINYDENGGNDVHNLPASGGVVTLFEGLNDILFYNNDTEYIVFSKSDKDATTRATTRTRTRATYLGNEYASEEVEETVTPPDMLYGYYIEDYLSEKVVEPTPIKVTLHPLVFTYKIRYEFESGYEYVSLARGALSGMARSVLMNTGTTSDEVATILYDCELASYGPRAVVKSFGVPSYPNIHYGVRTSDVKHALNLELLLRNGNIVTREFDVTEQVQQQPHGGVIVVKGIVVTEDEGEQVTGAFDVDVNDWGDYEDIEIPM